MKCEPLEKRFWDKVQQTDNCWLWIGHKNINGYGVFWCGGKKGGKRKLAHRLSYELAYGKFDEKLYVCHKCDNPPCVNPNHLFVGTQKDNMEDCSNKNRTGKNKIAKPFKLVDPNGNIVEGFNLAEFARKNGMNQGSLFNVASGRAKRAYGYTKAPD